MLTAKGMRFPSDIILVCIRWYAAYPLSYRHLEEMMEERGVFVDHAQRSSMLCRAALELERHPLEISSQARIKLFICTWLTTPQRTQRPLPTCNVLYSSETSTISSSSFRYFGGGNMSRAATTAWPAAIRSLSSRSSTLRSPSYSPRLRTSWHLANTRHTSGPSPSVCGST